jgi:CheY-like chemotaxis protein
LQEILKLNRQKAALVVDDSQPVRSVVASTLQSIGYRVLEAATGAAALAIAESESISLAVCDLYLDRETSGAAILEQAARLRPGLKCILISGSALPGQQLRTPFPVLSKPFPLKALVDLVERLAGDPD